MSICLKTNAGKTKQTPAFWSLAVGRMGRACAAISGYGPKAGMLLRHYREAFLFR